MKRGLDLIITIPALCLFLPIMAVIATLIRLTIGHPVIFRQERPGLHGKTFILYKFRTMTNKRNPGNELLPDGERLTGLGKFLRATSLDELPELFNILKNDMSIVGPRPLLTQYLELYTPEQMRRHEIKPGITGLAQVNGRNTITWEEKFKLDVWYVDNWSLWLDLKIIFQTFGAILHRRGINQSGKATVDYFTGSKNNL